MRFLLGKNLAARLFVVLLRREHFGFAIACFIAISLFALNYAFNDGARVAHAASYAAASRGVGEAYPHSLRRDIVRAISDSPEFVLRLSGRDMYEILDKPEFVRRDLPTVVWQYRTDSCVLDLYFTASGDNVLSEPVVHYEVRGRGVSGENVSERACVSALVKPREAFSLINAKAFYKASL